jgi:hypothetical protein
MSLFSEGRLIHLLLPQSLAPSVCVHMGKVYVQYVCLQVHPTGIIVLDYLYCDRQHNTFDVQFIYILHNMVILHVSTIIFWSSSGIT